LRSPLMAGAVCSTGVRRYPDDGALTAGERA